MTALCLALFTGLVTISALQPDFTRVYILGELAALEGLQTAALLATLLCALAVMASREARLAPGLRPWLGLVAAAVFLILAEEVSWGQHVFGWDATGWFHIHNDQGETNLHNTSSWLDQKPRALLLLAVFVGGVVHPLVKLARRGRGLIDRPWWLAPTLACLGPAVFVFLGGMPERFAEWGLAPKLRYLRSSEVEELFLYLFMLTYLLSLWTRLRRPASTEMS